MACESCLSLRTNASASSSSPGALFRTPLVTDSSRRGDSRPGASETRDDRAVASDHRLRAPRTGWLTEQESRVGDVVVPDRRTVERWGCYADAITRREQITGRPALAPALLNDADGPRPAAAFVEWLMGSPTGWVTDRHRRSDAEPTDHYPRQRSTATSGSPSINVTLNVVRLVATPP